MSDELSAPVLTLRAQERVAGAAGVQLPDHLARAQPPVDFDRYRSYLIESKLQDEKLGTVAAYYRRRAALAEAEREKHMRRPVYAAAELPVGHSPAAVNDRFKVGMAGQGIIHDLYEAGALVKVFPYIHQKISFPALRPVKG